MSSEQLGQLFAAKSFAAANMKKKSLLFYAIFLLFALAAKGDTTFDIADSPSFEGKSYYDVNKIGVHI